MTSPYIGLDYFSEIDAPFFFGRDADRTRLIGNLRASRLTLLYAQSGVGKSSLLRAGVAARLREIAQDRLGSRGQVYVPVVFSAWHSDPLPALIDELERAMRDVAPALELPRDSLQAAIAHITSETNVTPLIMLDQFEEYFLYHPEDGNDGFADELTACATLGEPAAHFLISIREDAYSRIGDRFGTRIPHVFANYLHLDYLGETSAREAIIQPLEHLNAHGNGSTPLSIEEELVDEVLRQVRRPASEDDEEDRFETPYLQLVMERLWNEDGASGTLRRETLDRLGGAAKIVRGHLEDAMAALPDDQRAAAAAALRFLVTSGGSKIALTAAELSELSGLPESALTPPLQWLEQRRVLRRAASPEAEPRYELFHDVLGAPVIEWRRTYEQHLEADRRAAEVKAEESQRLEEERARHRTQLIRITAAMVGLILVALVALVVVVLRQKDIAQGERSAARSHALAAAAEDQIGANPELSVQLARKAWEEDETDQAEQALRLSVSSFPTSGRETVPVPSNDLNAYADHKGRFVAILTSANTADIWDVEAGRWRPDSRLVRPGRIESVVWSGDDSTLVIAGRGGAIAMRPGEPPVLLTDRDVTSADVDRSGRNAAVAMGRTATVYNARSGHRLKVLRPGTAVRRVAFAPRADHELGVASCRDGNVRLWNWRSNRVHVLATRHGHVTHPRHRGSTGSCTVAFSADGLYVATAIRTDSPRIWTMPAGAYKTTLHSIFGNVTNLSWSSRNHEILIESTTGIRVYKGPSDYGADLDTSDNNLDDFDFSAPSETTTAATIGSDRRVAVGDEAGGIAIKTLVGNTPPVIVPGPGHTDRIKALRFVAGGRLMSVGADGTVRFWDVTPRASLLRTRGYSWMTAASFRPDGAQIAVAADSGTIQLVDTANHRRKTIKLKRRASSTYVSNFRYLPDGRLLVVWTRYGANDTVQVFNSKQPNASPVEPDVPELEQIREAAIAGGRLILIPDNSKPTAINMGTKRRVPLRWSSDVNARSVDVSRDGRQLVIGADDGHARVFSAPDLAPIADLGRRGGAMSGAIFSPDAKSVLTYGGDGQAHLWSVARKREVATLRGHTGRITSAAFSNDGRLIATGGVDGTTRIWKLDGHKVMVDRSLSPDRIVAVAFDPRSRDSLVTASDHTATLLHCVTCGSIQAVKRMARHRVKHDLTQRELDEFLG